ncbi:MAG TPA: flagellar hook-length control protein FliK [Clostridiales bacterium]|nr:flagellar hook-length control protein FliK [Clostridiales bacterium]
MTNGISAGLEVRSAQSPTPVANKFILLQGLSFSGIFKQKDTSFQSGGEKQELGSNKKYAPLIKKSNLLVDNKTKRSIKANQENDKKDNEIKGKQEKKTNINNEYTFILHTFQHKEYIGEKFEDITHKEEIVKIWLESSEIGNDPLMVLQRLLQIYSGDLVEVHEGQSDAVNEFNMLEPDFRELINFLYEDDEYRDILTDILDKKDIVNDIETDNIKQLLEKMKIEFESRSGKVAAVQSENDTEKHVAEEDLVNDSEIINASSGVKYVEENNIPGVELNDDDNNQNLNMLNVKLSSESYLADAGNKELSSPETDLQSKGASIKKEDEYTDGDFTRVLFPEGFSKEASSIMLEQPVSHNQNKTNEIISQIVDKARILIAGKKYEMLIEMKPEILGKVTLKVITENDAVIARFITENQHVKEVLESNFQTLKDSLKEQGLTVQGFSVSIAGDDSDKSYNNNQRNWNLMPENKNRRIQTRVEITDNIGISNEDTGYNQWNWSGNRINLMA